MADVVIEEEGDPEINELQCRLRKLEQQQDMLTKVVISSALGLELCTIKHVNLRKAIKDGRRVVLEVSIDETDLAKIDYAIE